MGCHSRNQQKWAFGESDHKSAPTAEPPDQTQWIWVWRSKLEVEGFVSLILPAAPQPHQLPPYTLRRQRRSAHASPAGTPADGNAAHQAPHGTRKTLEAKPAASRGLHPDAGRTQWVLQPPDLWGCLPAPGVQHEFSIIQDTKQGGRGAVSHGWGTNTQQAGCSNSHFPKCWMSSTGTHNFYPDIPKHCNVSGRFCPGRARPSHPSLLSWPW